MSPRCFLPLFVVTLSHALLAADDFVNFETPQVHPIDLSPNGKTLAICNTADQRVLLWDVREGGLEAATSVFVGMDPVSARFRTDGELWVVNQLSDSVSIIDLSTNAVKAVLKTLDEPADVVFAAGKAYVSCSQVNTIQVFNDEAPGDPLRSIIVDGEDPRALAVSPDGSRVYAAIFESGNSTTILGGGADEDENIIDFPPNVVNDPRGPYGGQNPPPNRGDAFYPEQNPSNPTPPKVGLIVRQHDDGRWLDDNGGDWTRFVSGDLAAASGRPEGWSLTDHDVAVVDTNTDSVSYFSRLMTTCMSLAVNPADGFVHVVGTDARNEIRFEPVVNGVFVRVQLGRFHPTLRIAPKVSDLNPLLDYSTPSVSMEVRRQSIGDPRALAWARNGEKGYVVGMGSNNVIVIGASGERIAPLEGIPVGEGPTGIAIDDAHQRAYILNRFEGSVSVLDLNADTELSRVSFFDPTPEVIKRGRRHLFDTHATSGNGQVACASCHLDTRMDRLAWDLGAPDASMKPLGAIHNLGAGLPGIDEDFTDFHPMKGPMVTQTLQDIIGKEPHHWRGDRDGLEEFNGAFTGLLGSDRQLTADEMQELEDYLATIHFPPNPYRNLDNSVPTDLPLTGQHTSGRFGNAGEPLPNGNAKRALTELYRPLLRGIDREVLACVTCHTLPTGMGTNAKLQFIRFATLKDGPLGERHHALVPVDGATQKTIKIAQLRNLYDKVGFDMTQTTNRAGFGFLHDGSVDSLARFLSEDAFDVKSDQDVADLVALMMSFSGSEFGDPQDILEPPGTASNDAHAAVGQQAVLGIDTAKVDTLLALAEKGAIEVIARATIDSQSRGWLYQGGRFQADSATQSVELAALQTLSASTPVVLMAVPAGSGTRLALDQDRDGLYDEDERRLLPSGIRNPFDPANPDVLGDNGAAEPDGVPDGENDFDGDGVTNRAEWLAGTDPADHLATPGAPQDLTVYWQRDGGYTLRWTAEAEARYQVEYTEDLVTWSPVNDALSGTNGSAIVWQDSAMHSRRFYRVRRLIE